MKKQNKIVYLTLLASLTFFVTACLKDDDSEKREKEKKMIENYVQVNNITATPSSTGLYFISQVEGTGATPSDKDYALIKYKATDLENKFYDGTDKALVEQNKVYPYFAIGGPLKIYNYSNYFYPGVIEGLKKMREGGKAKLIMPSSLASNDYVPRIFEVELLKVITDPNAYEKEQISNFLDTATTNTTLADSTNGIYFISRYKSTSTVYPAGGDSVKLKYKGYLPDGRVFDKTEDGLYKFKVGLNQAILGMDEGVRKMAEGDSATIVITYKKGYGFNQFVVRNQVVIPYFSTLIFEVKMVDIVKN